MAVAFDIVQNQDRPVAGRQPRNGSLQSQTFDGEIHSPVKGRQAAGGRLRRFVFWQLEIRVATPERLDDHIDGDAMNPCPKRRLSAKAGDFSEGSQESFLQQILGFIVIPSHAQANRKYPIFMSSKESLARLIVSPDDLLDQVRFSVPGVRTHDLKRPSVCFHILLNYLDGITQSRVARRIGKAH